MKYSKSSNLLLIITAIIWGFAFVAQSLGMKYIGPFTFNAIRFALGGLSLYPVIWLLARKTDISTTHIKPFISVRYGGILIGIVLFIGATLQQIGIVDTTAGNAGFITGLYVVLVPVFGIFLKQKTHINLWIGAILAVVGLYFLCIQSDFSISKGDLIILIGAFFWAGHVHLIGYFSPLTNAVKLAQVQFFVCSILSFLAALFFEDIHFDKIILAIEPILYGGILSVGVAYTLQVVAQKKANPVHASIILSLEAVFAVIGGWLILHESLSLRSLLGCCLMFAGILFAQINFTLFPKKENKKSH